MIRFMGKLTKRREKRVIAVSRDVLGISNRFRAGANVNGSRRATLDFFACLARYGTCDEYHFYTNKPINPAHNVDDRFRIYPYGELAANLRRFRYEAFHHVGPTPNRTLLTLRGTGRVPLVPITSVTYTVSYAFLPWRKFGLYCAYPTFPCDTIFACSHAVRKTLLSYFSQMHRACITHRGDPSFDYHGAVEVVPLGIDLEHISGSRIDKQSARSKLGLPQDAFVVLSFGRFSASLKCDLFPLVSAFMSVHAKTSPGTDLYLVLAGAGDDDRTDSTYHGRFQLLHEYIRSLDLQGRVRFIHRPSDEERGWIHSAADVFVSLSDNIQESFGLTVAEALAMGLPAIVSDWDGYRDIVTDGEEGFLIPTYSCSDPAFDDFASRSRTASYHFRQSQAVAADLECFQRCLLQLTRDAALRERMALKAAARGEQLSWKHIIEQYECHWHTCHEKSLECKRAKPWHEPKKGDISDGKFFRLNYGESFGHFASRWLQANWFVARGSVSTLCIGAAYWNLSGPLLVSILQVLEQEWQSAPWIGIKRIVEGLHATGDHPQLTEEETVRHVVWLVKQGVLQCDAPLRDETLLDAASGVEYSTPL